MRAIHIDEVIIEAHRQRSSMSEEGLAALADSIHTVSLLHPIVLQNDGRTLKAGERRLNAVKQLAAQGKCIRHESETLPVGWIPYTLLSDLSTAQLYQVELDENIQREDLSVLDRAKATRRLFELFSQCSQERGEEVTIQDFARSVSASDVFDASVNRIGRTVRDSIIIANNAHLPGVEKAKTVVEALKIVATNNQRFMAEELGRMLAETGAQAGTTHAVHNASCFDVEWPEEHFDVIATDPPYGIDMHTMPTQSGSSSNLTHNYQDDHAYARKCVEFVATAGYKAAKQQAACFMFCDLEHYAEWKTVFEAAGWYVWSKPLFWNKSPVGSLLGRANGPRHVYETILYAIKGDRGVTRVGADIISIPGPSVNKDHPAEKPVELWEHLLGWTVAPGDRVVDFFCGSGNIFLAATNLACSAHGAERDPGHYSKAYAKAAGIVDSAGPVVPSIDLFGTA